MERRKPGQFTGEGHRPGEHEYTAEAPQAAVFRAGVLMAVWPGNKRRGRECSWKGRLGPHLEEL